MIRENPESRHIAIFSWVHLQPISHKPNLRCRISLSIGANDIETGIVKSNASWIFAHKIDWMVLETEIQNRFDQKNCKDYIFSYSARIGKK